MNYSLKYICLFIILLLIPLSTISQDIQKTRDVIRLIVDGVIKDADFKFIDKQRNILYTSTNQISTDSNPVLKSTYNDWRYWTGILDIAMFRIGKTINEKKYTEFARKNLEFCFNNYEFFQMRHKNESKWDYPFGQFFMLEELDDCGSMGAAAIEIYNLDKKIFYRKYITRTIEHMSKKQSRIEDGTFVRSFPRRWTLWADDLYMGLSFLSRYAEFTKDRHVYDEAANQVINFHKHLFDKEKGLMCHCWFSDTNVHGIAFWGRANGWALLAQMDLLDRIPRNHPKYYILKKLFKEQLLGVISYQDSVGLWHQLLDKNDSYPETSCSAIFTYVILRAIKKNILDHSYISIAKKAWESILTKIQPDGKIEGVCTGTVVSDDLSYYYHRPTPLNDVHGVGVVLLAGSEILKLSR